MSGTIRIETLPPDGLPGLIARVEEALRRARAARLQVSNDTIWFRGGFLRGVTNWNVLVPISSGEIHFSRSDSSAFLHYRISFLGLFLVATVLVLIPLVSVSDPIRSDVIFTLPFLWLLLFGANYLTARFRFPRFLASAVGVTLPDTRPFDAPFPDY